ncbi:hypothetical protein HHX47_DHR8000366 [Lentinula edodes]|nr:hypothetical protein HHX47_DHR8000366 [Lentinula edodes]
MTAFSDDDRELVALGYVPSFKREFSNLATISFAFSIMYRNDPQYSASNGRTVLCGFCYSVYFENSIRGLCIGGLVLDFGGKHVLGAWLKVGWLVGWLNILVIIIVLLATTPRSEMHAAGYVFGSQGIVNQTGGWNNGLAFVFGLLSVQWTMTDYDATAHICEEVRRAAYAAPTAIFIAVIGPLADLPGASGSAFLQPGHVSQDGKSRFPYIMGLPDRGFFGYNSKVTQTPLRSIVLCTLVSIIPGLLDLASPIAANAIFALTAIALDLSYIIPIFLRRVFQNHPDVMFKPGPFYMGGGMLGWAANWICICWTLFVCVIFSFPVTLPVTPETMNYASVITVGVMVFAFIWYILDGHRHYHGPQSNIKQDVEPEKEFGEVEKDSEDHNGSDYV